MKTLPNFFVVGAARSGTTSLNRYLSQHPEIFITPRKEPHFFAADHFPRNGPGDEMLNQRVIADEAQYTQLFADVKGAKAIGESSVFYLCFPGTAERIAAVAPNSKIIVLLREPADRAFSAYMLLVRDGRETLGFVDGLSQEEERRQIGFEPMWWYKEAGLYYHQVKRYLDVFGTERVKVVLYDELFTHPEQTLHDVFSFLAVRPDISINTTGHYNMGGVPKSRGLYTCLYNFAGKAGPLVNNVSPLAKHIKPALAWKAIGMFLRPVEKDIQIHARLKAYFAEDVGNLETLLHQDLRHWQAQEPSIT